MISNRLGRDAGCSSIIGGVTMKPRPMEMPQSVLGRDVPFYPCNYLT